MNINKLVETLNDYLTAAGRKKRVQCSRIDELLEKLKKKKIKLKNKLQHESDNTKRKRLKTNLKIVSLQLKKGNKRRDELKEKCK